MSQFTLYNDDCLAILRNMPSESVDSVVTDPPYGISFMGKGWDYDVPSTDIWRECLRVLKPGGHLLAFAGTRTQHRMAVRIEDAGFEIRDMIAWVYGSGFPKSLDVSKAIDGHVTNGRSDSLALREVNVTRPSEARIRPTSTNGHRGIVGSADAGPSVKRDHPATPEAQQWAGWGTALKPALEPITMARKPLAGTVAANVLAHGTGGLNVDGCRVGAVAGDEPLKWEHGRGMGFHGAEDRGPCAAGTSPGRWPANLIHDGSDEVVGLFPEAGNGWKRNYAEEDYQGRQYSGGVFGGGGYKGGSTYCDSGSAARFFYTAKASRQDRGEGNNHPTVKPADLMRYLCRLVTPPGGIVLDPFMGSGSTGKAAMLGGFSFIGVERDPAYFDTAEIRIEEAANRPKQTLIF